MKPTTTRVVAAVAFATLTTLLFQFLPGDRLDRSSAIWLFLLGAVLAYAGWPAVSAAAAAQGSHLDPSWRRLGWSVAAAALLAVPFLLVAWVLQGGSLAPSQGLAAFGFFAAMAYLAWGGARRAGPWRRGW